MSRISLSVLILYLSLHHGHGQQCKISDIELSEPDTNNFDILLFSQEWPVTICKNWIQVKNGTECAFPNKKNQWSIHGIWPTTIGGHSPVYCNNSWGFDPEQIKSIEGELEQVWINVHKGTNSYVFWEHEWLKHGTCATDLENFNSQFKYFSKAIVWHQKYYLLAMFDDAKLFPDDTKKFTPDEFVAAVKPKTGKDAMVGCFTIDDIQYLAEMRICFDKQLNLIDCPVTAMFCDVSKEIIFPANA